MVPVDAGEAGLVEAVNGEVVQGVLPDDLDRFLIGFEGVHEDEGHVHTVLGV